MFMRRCEHCGHMQAAMKPQGNMTEAYRTAKCKNCGSEALDKGREVGEKKDKET